MFKGFKELKSRHQIIFSLLIGIGVISFWRGIWELSDIYIFPNNLELSLWTSVIIGALIVFGSRHAIKELT